MDRPLAFGLHDAMKLVVESYDNAYLWRAMAQLAGPVTDREIEEFVATVPPHPEEWDEGTDAQIHARDVLLSWRAGKLP